MERGGFTIRGVELLLRGSGLTLRGVEFMLIGSGFTLRGGECMLGGSECMLVRRRIRTKVPPLKTVRRLKRVCGTTLCYGAYPSVTELLDFGRQRTNPKEDVKRTNPKRIVLTEISLRLDTVAHSEMRQSCRPNQSALLTLNQNKVGAIADRYRAERSFAFPLDV
jgi:hypothetical protein